MEVIGKNKASQYRKECDTKKHRIKKVISGKQRWVAGPDLTAAELATRMEAIKQYDATNDTNPRCTTISKNWFTNQLKKLTEVQENHDEKLTETRTEVTGLCRMTSPRSGNPRCRPRSGRARTTRR